MRTEDNLKDQKASKL